jgi:hypothetical protein
MSQQGDHQSSNSSELHHFEKNRYFQGKLMTARDMLTDQQYHTDRLETISKQTFGTGILTGLTVSEFTDEGDRIQVTVEPGLALDPMGRPIVVRNPSTQTIPKPDGDELFLYIEHDTELKDPVPVPGKEPLSNEDSEESRILEVFTITARETAPDQYKTVTPFEFPDFDTRDKSPAELADEVASSYHDQRRATVDSSADPTVFLGSFKRTTEGDWRQGTETKRRPFVYDTDMLFTLVLTHLTDTDNPHSTRIGEPTDYIESELDQIEGFSVRLQQLRNEMQELSSKLDVHTDYVTHKSLESAVRFFDSTATSFEQFAEISRASLDIVDATREALANNVPKDRTRYEEFVESLLGDLHQLASELDGTATEETYRSFERAIEELDDSTDEDVSLVQMATALDKVGEAAENLEPRFDVVPGGAN